MKRMISIALSVIVLTVVAGCSGQTDKPAPAVPSSKPIPATSGPAKEATSTANGSPTIPADEALAVGSKTAAEGESPTDTDSESPDETADDPESTEPPAPKVEGAVNSVALAREFEKDQDAAEAKYKNKTVIVEGKVG